MNKGIVLVTVTGIEVKQLQGGSTLGILRGTTPGQRKENGQWVDDPIALEFSGFNSQYKKTADEIGALRQGTVCLVEYKLGQNRWIDNRTNQPRQRVTFLAEAVHRFDGVKATPQAAQQQQAPQQQTHAQQSGGMDQDAPF